MKTYNYLIYLFVLVFTLSITSCSDSDSDNSETDELLVGEWLLNSYGTYFCDTHEVNTPDQMNLDWVYVFKENGTWGRYNNGTYEGEEATEYSQQGTWEYLTEDSYSFYWQSDDISEVITIQFIDNNKMKYNISECWELSNGKSVYEYGFYTRE